MRFKTTDIVSICTFVVATASMAAGTPGFAGAIDNLTGLFGVKPGIGSSVLVVLGSVSLMAGLLLRIITNPTAAPAQSVSANASVVPANTAVTHSDTPKTPLLSGDDA